MHNYYCFRRNSIYTLAQNEGYPGRSCTQLKNCVLNERYVLEGSSVLEYTQYIDMRTVKSGLDQGSVPFQLNSFDQLLAQYPYFAQDVNKILYLARNSLVNWICTVDLFLKSRQI